MQGFLILVLTVALWILYHKLFNVIYFNAPVALLREIVICGVLSVLIISGISSTLGAVFHPSGRNAAKTAGSSTEAVFNTDRGTSSESASGDAFFSSFPFSSDAGDTFCWGSYYNESFLDGVNGNWFETWISFEPSENLNDGVLISGYAYAEGFNYQQNFSVDIPTPEGNTFSCEAPWSAGVLTITFHPESNTLEVTQEAPSSEDPSPYEGSYIDGDTWAGLIDERRAARQEIQDALQPDYWLEKYYGAYVLESFADGIEGAPYLWFEIEKDQNSPDYFRLTNGSFSRGGADEYFNYRVLLRIRFQCVVARYTFTASLRYGAKMVPMPIRQAINSKIPRCEEMAVSSSWGLHF